MPATPEIEPLSVFTGSFVAENIGNETSGTAKSTRATRVLRDTEERTGRAVVRDEAERTGRAVVRNNAERTGRAVVRDKAGNTAGFSVVREKVMIRMCS